MTTNRKINPIVVARKAIKKAIASGQILMDTSAMCRVGLEAIASLSDNQQYLDYCAWEATKDVKFGI